MVFELYGVRTIVRHKEKSRIPVAHLYLALRTNVPKNVRLRYCKHAWQIFPCGFPDLPTSCPVLLLIKWVKVFKSEITFFLQFKFCGQSRVNELISFLLAQLWDWTSDNFQPCIWKAFFTSFSQGSETAFQGQMGFVWPSASPQFAWRASTLQDILPRGDNKEALQNTW